VDDGERVGESDGRERERAAAERRERERGWTSETETLT
jgi:hypothetical protein